LQSSAEEHGIEYTVNQFCYSFLNFFLKNGFDFHLCFEIGGCGIDSKGAKSIFDSLKINTSITKLNLGGFLFLIC